MTDEFVVGQRWISETESQLGLGMVEGFDHRLVKVYFPSIDETRHYARKTAPLSRIIFKQGDALEDIDENSYTVIEVEDQQGIAFYRCHDAAGTEVLVSELKLNHILQLTLPMERLFTGQINDRRWFDLKYSALQHIHRLQQSNVTGLYGARTDLIPHQLYTAYQVAQRHAPRVLLADEVGLGKTIEAGLIIHQQLLTERSKRILVVVPEALVHQWFVEMFRRFNLHFHIFDNSRYASLIDSGEEQPFATEQLILCSVDFLMQQDIHEVVDSQWDIVVVDEAHHIEWSEEKSSSEYDYIEQLALASKGLLLLTATPEEAGKESHFARLRLLDPHRFHTLSDFLSEEENFQPIADIVYTLSELPEGELISEQTPDIKQQLCALVPDESFDNLSVASTIKQLLDRYGTGRVLFRNTRKNIEGFPHRKLHAYPLDGETEMRFDMDIEAQLYPETIANDNWCEQDPRADWLKQFLRQHSKEKVLIICHRQETAIQLELFLRYKHGLNTSVFHESMDIVSRDRAAAYFSDEEDGAQALICSEIGSEGRNFQFSHHLVLFDLPLNPDLLEQRIGRLDRIGQKQDINIHVPYFEDSAQAVLFRWFDQGLNAFQHTCSVGYRLYKHFEKEIHEAFSTLADENLITETQCKAKALNEQLDAGRDKLIELSSFDEDIAEDIIDEILNIDTDILKSFMEQAFDRYGISCEELSAFTQHISMNDHSMSHFPTLPEDGITITYDRRTALSREDIHFFTWEHPIVRATLESAYGSEFGTASAGLIKNKSIPAGKILVEAIYTINISAPSELEATRFLPCTPVRILLDQKKQDLSAAVNHAALQKLLLKLPKETGRKVIKQSEADIRPMLDHANELAEKQSNEAIAAAKHQVRKELDAGIERLTALSKKNTSIRDGEITFLRHQQEQLLSHLDKAQSQLYSVRIIFTA